MAEGRDDTERLDSSDTKRSSSPQQSLRYKTVPRRLFIIPSEFTVPTAVVSPEFAKGQSCGCRVHRRCRYLTKRLCLLPVQHRTEKLGKVQSSQDWAVPTPAQLTIPAQPSLTHTSLTDRQSSVPVLGMVHRKNPLSGWPVTGIQAQKGFQLTIVQP